jgi:hypothetical protein
MPIAARPRLPELACPLACERGGATEVTARSAIAAALRSRWRFVIPLLLIGCCVSWVRGQDDDTTLRVFVFAGQSNMVGSDSKAKDIADFPPFVGLDQPQPKVKFSYCIGREEKRQSAGWVDLQPVDEVLGPELSFARHLTQHLKAPIAVIKCAAGGTHLGGDWNPEEPSGFALYPLTLSWVRDALADLDRRKIRYRIEGFMWHQGENDMFDPAYMANYGKNLKRLLACWRRDLGVPDLRFYIGELCTKTIWGMDLRPNMYAISVGQREVTDADPLADYVPTSHIAVEIGGDVGLHYHYGTLGQLEHGVNYANAYLRSIGKEPTAARTLPTWPYQKGTKVRLFVLAGHRNMEGERAFVQDLKPLQRTSLQRDNPKLAFMYSLGGGYKVSAGFEPLGPAGYYDTFGPEVSFGARLASQHQDNVAIAKFTHSGTQIVDWTPAGSEAKSRNLYPGFLAFVREALQEITAHGNTVELAGIFYHVGENDMSFGPHRKRAAERVAALIAGTRRDLELPALKWFVSQQPPTDDASVNSIDVTSDLTRLASADADLIYVQAFLLPGRAQNLVITTEGIVALGELLADRYLKSRP